MAVWSGWASGKKHLKWAGIFLPRMAPGTADPGLTPFVRARDGTAPAERPGSLLILVDGFHNRIVITHMWLYNPTVTMKS